MAKEKSTDLVNEEADYQKRFEKLEADSAASKTILDQLAKKLLGTEPPKKEMTDAPPPKRSGIKGLFQDIGILAED